MIWLTFGMNPFKTKWLRQLFKKRWRSKKLVGTITYEPLLGLHSNLVGCTLGSSDDLINFWDESIKNKMAAAAIKKNDMVVVGVLFSHYYFLLLMDRAYGWGVLPSIDGYFYSHGIRVSQPRESQVGKITLYLFNVRASIVDSCQVNTNYTFNNSYLVRQWKWLKISIVLLVMKGFNPYSTGTDWL